jgi:hypothetical protein
MTNHRPASTLARATGVALLASAAAAVAPGGAAAEPATPHGYAGLRVGGIVPLGGLSPFAAFGVELGAVLPAMQRRLAIAIAVDYTQPTATGSEMDPRVAGGTYTWSLRERELAVMPLIVFRATQVKAFTPYVGIGPRVQFLESTVDDDGMPAFSPTTEVSTEVGVGVPIGGELRLGPGRLTAELLLQYGALDHVATGESHTGALGLTLGYRAFF